MARSCSRVSLVRVFCKEPEIQRKKGKNRAGVRNSRPWVMPVSRSHPVGSNVSVPPRCPVTPPRAIVWGVTDGVEEAVPPYPEVGWSRIGSSSPKILQ